MPALVATAQGSNAQRSRLVVAAVALTALCCLFQWWRVSHFLFVWSFVGAEAAAAVAAWVGSFRARPQRRLPYALVALGLTATVAGDTIWYLWIFDDAYTEVSFADAGWLASYVLYAAALWLILARSQR